MRMIYPEGIIDLFNCSGVLYEGLFLFTRSINCRFLLLWLLLPTTHGYVAARECNTKGGDCKLEFYRQQEMIYVESQA